MLLAKQAKTGIRSKQKRLPLHEAAAYGSLDVYKLLESKTFTDSTGVLHLSTLNPDQSVFEHLMKSATAATVSDPYPLEPFGTPLHYAVRGAPESTIKKLLSVSTSVSPLDKEGRTPLLVAVRSRQYSAARLLLEAGADPTQTDGFGVSVLSEADALNDPRMKDILVRRLRTD